ncbi:MAG TPA: aldo/keto reductase [Rhizomicrobium sp.]|jgi:aryl-alcohol dehydrogenase-like predicted oxidoreductase|nr:aldo/keto reductase [Rhizomicrobium sp.]
MQTRKLGTSTLDVSVVGLGCNNFGRLALEASRKVIDRALEQGITLFDTADVYGNQGGSEEQLGEILGERRKQIVLATKFGMKMDDAGKKSGASRTYIMQAVEDSLKRLRTDWIDLYQLHTPDPHTLMEETLRALDDLVRAGKVRVVGCSNLPAAGLAQARAISESAKLVPFVTAQDEYSLLVRDVERELVPTLQQFNMSLLPYFPLASGLLTGKYGKGDIPQGTRFAVMQRLADRYLTDRNLRIVSELQEFCTSNNRTMLELAFSWLAAQPTVASVIAGATKPEQIDQNVKAVDWKFGEADLAQIDRITQGA